MIDIGMIEVDAVDLGLALLLTLGATEIIKRVFVAVTHDERVRNWPRSTHWLPRRWYCADYRC
jgi:hypothetical protein